jgi:hypothetical protein
VDFSTLFFQTDSAIVGFLDQCIWKDTGKTLERHWIIVGVPHEILQQISSIIQQHLQQKTFAQKKEAEAS